MRWVFICAGLLFTISVGLVAVINAGDSAVEVDGGVTGIHLGDLNDEVELLISAGSQFQEVNSSLDDRVLFAIVHRNGAAMPIYKGENYISVLSSWDGVEFVRSRLVDKSYEVFRSADGRFLKLRRPFSSDGYTLELGLRWTGEK
jgi:hypothetical protein